MRTIAILILMLSCARAATWEEQVVAAVITGEARGEGRQGMVAVGEVIRQRSSERKQTPYQVVTTRKAFSSKGGMTSVQTVRRYSKEPEYATALEVAKLVCRTPERLPGITRQANAFDGKHRNPWWARKAKRVAVIGNHAFYRLPD